MDTSRSEVGPGKVGRLRPEVRRLRLTAARATAYRKRRREGLKVFSVEAPEADLIRALRFRGLPANPTKKQVEAKLSELLTDFARRWQSVQLP